MYMYHIYFSCCPQSLWKKHVQNLIVNRIKNCIQNHIHLPHWAPALIINIPTVAFFLSVPHTSFCFHKHSLLQEICINPQLKMFLKKSNVYTNFNNRCRKFWAFLLKRGGGGGVFFSPLFLNLCLHKLPLGLGGRAKEEGFGKEWEIHGIY